MNCKVCGIKKVNGDIWRKTEICSRSCELSYRRKVKKTMRKWHREAVKRARLELARS